MDQLLKPEGDVVAEHRASVAWRIVSVLLLAIPAAMWLTAAWSGPRENVAALSIPGAVLIALCVLVFVQQGKVRVVLRTDGVERWAFAASSGPCAGRTRQSYDIRRRACMPSAST